MAYFIDEVRYANIMRTLRQEIFFLDSDVPTVEQFTEFLSMGFSGYAHLTPFQFQAWENAIPRDSFWPHTFNHEKDELFGSKIGSLLHHIDLEIYGGYENIFTFDYLKRMATEYILPFKYNPVHGLTFYNAEEYYHLIVDRPDLMYS